MHFCKSVEQKRDCEVGLRVAARRLPKSSTQELTYIFTITQERIYNYMYAILVSSLATSVSIFFLIYHNNKMYMLIIIFK